MPHNILDISILLTAITGLATAIVALWNIREMRLMRAATSSPVLIAKNQDFAIVSGSNDAIFDPSDNFPSVNVSNFGNGPAINVCANWKIYDEAIVKLLRNYDPHNEFKISFEISPFVDEQSLKLYWNHFTNRQVVEQLNPVAPTKTGPPVKIKLPIYYVEAFHLYITLAVHRRQNKNIAFDLPNFPNSVLLISFEDLLGHKKQLEYDVQLSYSHNGTRLLGKDNTY